MGISKVNIFTDINIAAVAAALAHFTDMGKGIIDLLPSIRDAIKVSVSEKMQLFGCCGKAAPALAGGVDEATIRRIVEEVLRNRRG
jgi:fructose-bisphosphate aldolase class II